MPQMLPSLMLIPHLSPLGILHLFVRPAPTMGSEINDVWDVTHTRCFGTSSCDVTWAHILRSCWDLLCMGLGRVSAPRFFCAVHKDQNARGSCTVPLRFYGPFFVSAFSLTSFCCFKALRTRSLARAFGSLGGDHTASTVIQHLYQPLLVNHTANSTRAVFSLLSHHSLSEKHLRLKHGSLSLSPGLCCYLVVVLWFSTIKFASSRVEGVDQCSAVLHVRCARPLPSACACAQPRLDSLSLTTIPSH